MTGVAEHEAGRAFHEILCRGCGVVFQHHSSAVVYCNDDCRLRYRAAAKSGFCCICGAKESNDLVFIFSPEAKRLYEDDRLRFAAEHQPCRRALLEEEGRVIQCSCKRCCAVLGLPFMARAPRGAGSALRTYGYVKHADVVFDRDGYVCQICDRVTFPDARSTDEMYPVLDHVDQVRFGGSDEIDNLRTAHRWCNTEREHPVWGDDETVKEAAQLRFAVRLRTM